VTTVIKLKRGTSTPTTNDIVSGEVAVDTSAQKLYINDSGTVKQIGGSSGGGSLTVQEEGSSLSTAATTLNFVGSNVTASGTGATKTITISGGSEITVQDEGSALSTAATTLNFVGAGVTASGTGATKTITISGGSGGGVNVQGEVRSYTGDGSTTGFTVSSGANATNVMVFLNGVYQRPTTDYTVSGTTLTFGTAPVASEVIIIKEILESSAVDLTSISTDLTPDTHNAYDVGQLGSSFRDFTFVRKIQKNVEIFTTALGLNTVAANLGFNINTGTANMTEVYTNAGGLDSPVLGSDNSTYDDSNPAFLF